MYVSFMFLYHLLSLQDICQKEQKPLSTPKEAGTSDGLQNGTFKFLLLLQIVYKLTIVLGLITNAQVQMCRICPMFRTMDMFLLR